MRQSSGLIHSSARWNNEYLCDIKNVGWIPKDLDSWILKSVSLVWTVAANETEPASIASATVKLAANTPKKMYRFYRWLLFDCFNHWNSGWGIHLIWKVLRNGRNFQILCKWGLWKRILCSFYEQELQKPIQILTIGFISKWQTTHANYEKLIFYLKLWFFFFQIPFKN